MAILVINMIPNSLSNETNRDSEPNLSVNPSNPLQLAASAFTPDPQASGNGPIFVSSNGGSTWDLNVVLPGGNRTVDVTLRFATSSNVLYGGILRLDNTNMDILRKANFLAPGNMDILVDRANEDQPYVEAATTNGGAGVQNDRVYVGHNDFNAPASMTATAEASLDAATAPPTANFTSDRLEVRTTCGQDGPSIRPAIHANGTVYGAFFRWTSCGSAPYTADVVVVRDDNWGSGSTPFTALVDPSDSNSGLLVATGVSIPWMSLLGTQRIGSQLAVAVDPTDSQRVYLAWADGTSGSNYTVHLRRSIDKGVTWSGDLRTIVSATNPGLAVSVRGIVGLLYQKLTSPSSGNRWETHLERSSDGFASPPTDLILANVPDNNGSYTGQNPIGDYACLISLGKDFYGTFAANNTPNNTNFPNNVIYQRNANFMTNTLLDTDGVTPVAASIDPFFFKVPDGDIITKIEIDIETGTIQGAGTNGRVYLGICGREFRLDKPGDQFRVGILDNFIIGMGSNIENPNSVNDIINSPNSYEIDTFLLDIFPKYIRFEPQGNDDNWNVSRVELRVTDDTNIVHNFDALISNGSIWLGENSGLLLGLS
jgi:hypothetical protein